MKTPLYIFLILILSFMAGSCISTGERETTLKLNRIERQLDSLPGRESGQPYIDSLEAIPASALTSPRLRALHSLLLTQARRKEGLPVNQDSLLIEAHRYYTNAHDPRRLMKASLYRSVASQNEGNYNDAFYYAIRAYHIADNLGEPLWIARTAEQRALLARDKYYREEEYEYSLKAAQYYDKAGFTINAQYCYIDVADYFTSVYQYEKGEHLLDIIINNATDSIVLFNALTYSVDNLLYQRKYEKAGKNLDRLEQTCNIDNWDSGVLLTKAQVEMHRGNNPLPYLERAKSGLDFVGMKTIYYSTLLEYYENKKEFRRAFAYADSLLKLDNNFFRESLKDNTSLQIKDFYEVLSIKAEADFSHTSVIVAALLFLLNLSVSVFLLIFYLKKVRRISLFISNRHNLHHQISTENIRLLEKITEYSNQNEQLTYRQGKLFQQQWDTLNNLCKEYFRSDNNDLNRKNVYESLEKQLLLLKKQNNLDSLIKQADYHLKGIITLFQTECPGLSPKIYQLFGLIAAGFGSKIICFLTDITPDNLYARKKRMLTKINAIQPPHLELFTAFIQNI